MELDLDRAFEAYNARFDEALGDKPIGSYAKFDTLMIQRLAREEFPQRLEDYLTMHSTVKGILANGATISDDVCLEFQERACWLVIRAPNLLEMFKGEVGDPSVATGTNTAE